MQHTNSPKQQVEPYLTTCLFAYLVQKLRFSGKGIGQSFTTLQSH